MVRFKLPGMVVLLIFIISNCHDVFSYDKLSEKPLPYGCTVITVSKGDSVFFGGNDDYNDFDSYYWIQPGDSSRYGVVWIGTPDNPQQGINEKGLAYDSNGLPRIDVNPHPERVPVPGEYHNYCMQIMHECSTVQQVIEWVSSHQRHPYMHDQLHFADATGDAVIISAGKDGEMVFTRKEPGDGFLVSTNFNIANPSHGFGYPCWRFNQARDLLGDLIEADKSLSHSDITDIMDAVHQEGASWTKETMVADLVKGVIYLYYFYQYDRPVVLNVEYELANPREPGPLSQLFPEDVREEARIRYEKNRAGLKVSRRTGLLWPALVLISLILLFTITADYRKGLRIWLPAVLILGPVALIFRLLPAGRASFSVLKYAIIETLGNLIPLVIAFTAVLAIMILMMLSGNASPQLQVILMFGLPLIFGLIFHTAFLASASKRNYFRYTIMRLPQVLVITFLGLGGIIPVALPLANNNLSMSLLLPLSPLAVTSWWTFVVYGSVPGGLLILIYELWAVKRGYLSWSSIEEGNEKVNSPAWKKIWWWLPVSFAVILSGIILGVVLVNN